MKIIILLSGLFFVISLFSQVTLDPRYHTNEEIYDELSALQTEYPDIVHLIQIGTTFTDNLPIWAVKLSDNASENEDEPAVMFAGQCHAEEVLGVEITMWMINEIVQHHFQTPYSIWLQNTEMWFVPTYNPEGLQVVMDGLDDSFRKNKRDNNENGVFDFVPGPGEDIDGVDTNRNYGFNWVHGDTLYSTGGEELYDYYRGPYPFSEGGTQAIKNLAEQEHIIFSINWHSSRTGNFSEKVFYSFEWDGEKFSPDFALNELIGQTVAGLIETEDNIGHYEPSPSRGRKGSAHDWFYQAHGTIQLLIECGTQNLQPPAELVDDTCQRCSAGAYWLLNRVLGYQASGSMLTGHITNENTGEPVVAEVIVEEKNASYFAPRLSDADFGRFWRPLLPGTYTLRVRKKGFEEKVISGIVINNSGWTNRDIQLTPLNEVNIYGTITSSENLLNGSIVVFDLQNDTINFVNGNYNFTTFEGELDILIVAENHVPKYFSTIVSNDQEINFHLSSSETIFAESWENDLANWIIDGDWAISNEAVSGNFSLRNTDDLFYSHGVDHTIQFSQAIDLQDQTAVMLTFWHKYHIEHDNDIVFVEISPNGNDWIILKQYSGVNNWQKEFISLNDYLNENIYLRLRFQSDATLNDPGWFVDDIKILSTDVLGTDNNSISQVSTHLYNNYPNPFNPETTISFSLNPKDAKNAKIEIYNIKGQKVKTFSNIQINKLPNKQIFWNGTDDEGKTVSSGIYFYRLKTDNFAGTKKMILMK